MDRFSTKHLVVRGPLRVQQTAVVLESALVRAASGFALK